MKNLIRPALALLALTPFVQARLEENLPVTTYAVAKIENVPATRKNIDANPLHVALKTARFEEFVKPLVEKFGEQGARALIAPEIAGKDGDKSPAELAKDFEATRDEILAALSGEVAVAIVKTPDPVPGHLPYDYVALADTKLDGDALVALFKKLGIHQPVKPKAAPAPKTPGADDDDDTPAAGPVAPELFAGDEDYRGVTLHTLFIKEGGKPVTISGWALVNGTLVFATAPNVLRDLVDARQSGRKDGFADGALYKTSADALKGTDAWVLADMPLVAGALHDLVVKKTEKGGGLPGFDLVKAFDSLGLDAFSRLRASVTLAPDDTRFDTDIAWSEKRGLAKILAASLMKDATPDLSTIPPDVLAANAARVDLAAGLKEFESLLKSAAPALAPMLDMQIAKMKSEGLDIRSAILENLGDEVASITDGAPAGAEGMPTGTLVYALSLRDPAKFESFVETALGKIAAEQTGDGAKSLFDERDFMGVRIRTLKQGAPGVQMRYAVKGKTLYLSMGDARLLDRVLAQRIEPKKSLADDAGVKAALAKLGGPGAAVSYVDLGRYIESLASTLGGVAKHKGYKPGPELDMTKAPRAADLPFIAVGTSTIGDNEVSSRTLVVRKTDAGR